MKKTFRKAIFALPIAAIAIALPLISNTRSSTVTEGQIPHWDYGGQDNPTRWGELSPASATCGNGRAQSPINLVRQDATTKPGAAIVPSYKATPLAVTNNGHSIQVDYEPGSYINIDGAEYELLQFHFHTHSEHTLDDKASAMEMHLVHKNDAGELAVLGVLIEQGAANPELAKIWANMPQTTGTSPASGSINAADFLPSDPTHYHYMGSLTTPPCTEGVNWNILTTPITASEEQIEQFMALYLVNARPIQATNNREVEVLTPAVPGLW
jgi:carbonic anhydrase